MIIGLKPELNMHILRAYFHLAILIYTRRWLQLNVVEVCLCNLLFIVQIWYHGLYITGRTPVVGVGSGITNNYNTTNQSQTPQLTGNYHRPVVSGRGRTYHSHPGQNGVTMQQPALIGYGYNINHSRFNDQERKWRASTLTKVSRSEDQVKVKVMIGKVEPKRATIVMIGVCKLSALLSHNLAILLNLIDSSRGIDG
jgi:hypothetical protein